MLVQHLPQDTNSTIYSLDYCWHCWESVDTYELEHLWDQWQNISEKSTVLQTNVKTSELQKSVIKYCTDLEYSSNQIRAGFYLFYQNPWNIMIPLWGASFQMHIYSNYIYTVWEKY